MNKFSIMTFFFMWLLYLTCLQRWVNTLSCMYWYCLKRDRWRGSYVPTAHSFSASKSVFVTIDVPAVLVYELTPMHSSINKNIYPSPHFQSLHVLGITPSYVSKPTPKLCNVPQNHSYTQTHEVNETAGPFSMLFFVNWSVYFLLDCFFNKHRKTGNCICETSLTVRSLNWIPWPVQ